MARVVVHYDVAEQIKRETALAYWRTNASKITAAHRQQAPIDTGLLRASHILEPPVRTVYGFLMVLLIKAPYARAVHGGHGWIYPKQAKALRWVTKQGVVVFAAKVRPVKGNNWTIRAWKQLGFKRIKLAPLV